MLGINIWFIYLIEICHMNISSRMIYLVNARAVDHFGRIHEPKRTDASGAWYKTYDWRGNGNDLHYFVNDLLGERIPITREEYNNTELTQPS